MTIAAFFKILFHKISYHIFIQYPRYRCNCYKCYYRRNKEQGFIYYLHCSNCDKYFYRLKTYISHFEISLNNQLDMYDRVCLYPVLLRSQRDRREP